MEHNKVNFTIAFNLCLRVTSKALFYIIIYILLLLYKFSYIFIIKLCQNRLQTKVRAPYYINIQVVNVLLKFYDRNTYGRISSIEKILLMFFLLEFSF